MPTIDEIIYYTLRKKKDAVLENIVKVPIIHQPTDQTDQRDKIEYTL